MVHDSVDMTKLLDKLDGNKEALNDEVVLCLGFIEELEQLTNNYMTKVKALMRTYKHEVALMDTAVNLSVVSWKELIFSSTYGCEIDKAKKLISKSLVEDDKDAEGK